MRRTALGVLCVVVILLGAWRPVRPAPQQGLVAGPGRFLLDGEPIQIRSGELHYPRIPREYWRDRLLKARVMGLNTVSTYVFWNLHEPEPGRFDFTGIRDVAAFVRTAGELGLHVIVRPGPYVCAEWDLGGYPAWLFRDPDIELRGLDPDFTRPVERWLERLGQELRPLLRTRGGPIVAVQIENEYGSFDRDQAYMAWHRDALVRSGFGDVLLFTADGDIQLPDGSIAGVPAVVNFGVGGARNAFKRLAEFRPGAPLMTGEYWAGWFDHWGRAHSSTNLDRQVDELDWMMAEGHSFNLYMFHGGTTFGFMNGANIDNGRYFPQTTSYDYDAALDESGRATAKYTAFRNVIIRRLDPDVDRPPPIPTPPPIAVPAFAVEHVAPLWDTLSAPRRSDRPPAMEAVGPGYGYILYRTTLPGTGTGVLELGEVRDYVQIYVDGRLAGTLDRRLGDRAIALEVPRAGARLDLLFENTGRVNFRKDIRTERKGLVQPVTFAGRELLGWDVFPLPMAAVPRPAASGARPDGPGFHRGTFMLVATGDTFLDTRGWGKGTVWVNGHHLGRFWSIGPQQTLYVPGPWLRQGENEVVVFTLGAPTTRTMRGLAAPILDQLAPVTR